MRKTSVKIGYGVVAAGAAALVLCAAFEIMGSVGVLDSSATVVSAVVTTGTGPMQALRRFPGGIFYTVPDRDGIVEVHCSNGSRNQRGYVTRHRHTWLRVQAGPGCSAVVEIRRDYEL